jgi:hypothetical protein
MKQCCAIDSVTTKRCENLIPVADEVCFLHLKELEFWMDVIAEERKESHAEAI